MFFFCQLRNLTQLKYLFLIMKLVCILYFLLLKCFSNFWQLDKQLIAVCALKLVWLCLSETASVIKTWHHFSFVCFVFLNFNSRDNFIKNFDKLLIPQVIWGNVYVIGIVHVTYISEGQTMIFTIWLKIHFMLSFLAKWPSNNLFIHQSQILLAICAWRVFNFVSRASSSTVSAFRLKYSFRKSGVTLAVERKLHDSVFNAFYPRHPQQFPGFQAAARPDSPLTLTAR